jgi:hypothetical protein
MAADRTPRDAHFGGSGRAWGGRRRDPAAELGGVPDDSLIEEMRIALRGDRDRAQGRRRTVLPGMEAMRPEPEPEPDSEEPVARTGIGVRIARLLRRG